MPGTTTIRLKLLVDKKKKKVVFAEAGKDFVDFLFSLFALPLGTVVGLLKKEDTDGSLGHLHTSVEGLSLTHLQPGIKKFDILKPKNTSVYNTSSLPLLLADDQMSSAKLYMCSTCTNHVTLEPMRYCQARPACYNSSIKAVTWVGTSKAGKAGAGNSETGGYVMGLVTYMVTDDLVVQPMSTISSIELLNKMNITEIGGLAEKIVELDMAKGLKLLKESLSSRTVLSNVFLHK